MHGQEQIHPIRQSLSITPHSRPIEQRLLTEGADDQADACDRDWEGHTAQVEAATIPLPETVTPLLAQLEEEIDKLTKTSPVAAVRAARRLEVVAERVGYWAARDTTSDLDAAQAAVHLGLDADAARRLMARFGRWSRTADPDATGRVGGLPGRRAKEDPVRLHRPACPDRARLRACLVLRVRLTPGRRPGGLNPAAAAACRRSHAGT